MRWICSAVTFRARPVFSSLAATTELAHWVTTTCLSEIFTAPSNEVNAQNHSCKEKSVQLSWHPFIAFRFPVSSALSKLANSSSAHTVANTVTAENKR